MDKMIHTALNTLKNLSANRAVRAQNMSNLNVPGHRKDLNTNFTSGFLHQVNQYDSRVFAIHAGGNGFSNNAAGGDNVHKSPHSSTNCCRKLLVEPPLHPLIVLLVPSQEFEFVLLSSVHGFALTVMV